jgi:hypothetical protein
MAKARGSVVTLVRLCGAMVMIGAAALMSSRNVQARQDLCYSYCGGVCRASCYYQTANCGAWTAGGTYPSCECGWTCYS